MYLRGVLNEEHIAFGPEFGKKPVTIVNAKNCPEAICEEFMKALNAYHSLISPTTLSIMLVVNQSMRSPLDLKSLEDLSLGARFAVPYTCWMI